MTRVAQVRKALLRFLSFHMFAAYLTNLTLPFFTYRNEQVWAVKIMTKYFTDTFKLRVLIFPNLFAGLGSFWTLRFMVGSHRLENFSEFVLLLFLTTTEV